MHALLRLKYSPSSDFKLIHGELVDIVAVVLLHQVRPDGALEPVLAFTMVAYKRQLSEFRLVAADISKSKAIQVFISSQNCSPFFKKSKIDERI